MNIIAGGFYDGLMLYVHALNETMLASGIRPSGKKVTKRMWNRTFHGSGNVLQDFQIQLRPLMDMHHVTMRPAQGSVEFSESFRIQMIQ
ncbi:hypothetical protein AMECASPLE_023517 [Ameca splendens]|uniref:Uncharacterized protein n=1 Tax=Ameca splendens TaxID=208324 RepID=A0ABV1ABB2_9TELE